jgi:hypothetical protein
MTKKEKLQGILEDFIDELRESADLLPTSFLDEQATDLIDDYVDYIDEIYTEN